MSEVSRERFEELCRWNLRSDSVLDTDEIVEIIDYAEQEHTRAEAAEKQRDSAVDTGNFIADQRDAALIKLSRVERSRIDHRQLADELNEDNERLRTERAALQAKINRVQDLVDRSWHGPGAQELQRILDNNGE